MESTTVTSAPSAGAETSSAASTTPTSPSSFTSPADRYVQMAAEATATPVQPAPAAEAVTTAGDAPVQPAEAAQAEAKQDEAQAAVDPEAEERELQAALEAALPEDVKTVMRDKPWLRTAYYQAKGMRQLGFTLEGLRTAARSGLTEQTLGEITTLFPAGVEDARRSAQLANSMQRLQHDFTNDPQAFIRNLAEADPEAAQRIVRQVAQALPQVDRESYVQTVSAGMWTALERVEQGATQSGNERIQLAAQILREELFPGSAQEQQQGQQPQLPPDVQKRLTELEGREQSFRQQQVQSYQNEIRDSAIRGTQQEVDRLFAEANPSGLSEAGVGRAKSEALQAIANDFLGNPVIMADFNRMVQNGVPQDQILNWVGARITKLAPRRVAEVFRFYTKEFFARPGQTTPTQRPAAVAPPRDIGSVGGTARPAVSIPEFVVVPNGVPYHEQFAQYQMKVAAAEAQTR